MATQDEIRAKDILPHKTSFSEGDGFYGDGDSSFFMEAGELLRATAENVENFSLISDGNVLNGKVHWYRSGNSNITHVYQKNAVNSFILRATSGSTWSYYKTPFTPDYSKKIKIFFDAALTENNTHPNLKLGVYVSSGSGSWVTDQQILVKSGITPSGSVLLEFDASIYPDFNWTNCNVWIAISGYNGYVSEVCISNLQVYQIDDKVDFNNFSGENLRQILESVDAAIVSGDIMADDKTNGKLLNIKEGNSDITSVYQKNSDGSFILHVASSGSRWSYYATPFVPDFSTLVKITFDVEATENNLNPNVDGSVYVSNGRTTYAEGECFLIAKFNPSMGKVSVTFDPTYYQIYMNPAWTQFNVWIAINGVPNLVSELKISNLKVYQLDGEVLFENFGGETERELLERIDDAITRASTADKDTMVSPNGTKYFLTVQNDGSISTIPVKPSKCVYFGNSLLLGSGSYGLTASDDEHDYYYLINNYIQQNINENFIASRYSGTAFEGITNPANISSVVSGLLEYLDGDEDLVVVQLGDNVNTAEKLAVFESSAAVLLQAIRSKCTRARVVWFGMWYGSSTKFEIIGAACKNTGCEFVSMVHINKTAGQSYIGAVQKKPLGDYTLSDVSNVENVGGGYIHITFSVSGNEYTSEILVNSWNFSGTTLTYNGEYTVVTSPGVASHPGDVGMRDIANLFLHQLGYSETEDPIAE